MKRSAKVTVILAPLFPLLMKIIYLPFDVFITVKVLGCEGEPGFNANDFNNKVMMPLVLLISLVALVRCSRNLSGWKKVAYLIFGGLVQIILSLCWGMFVWM